MLKNMDSKTLANEVSEGNKNSVRIWPQDQFWNNLEKNLLSAYVLRIYVRLAHLKPTSMFYLHVFQHLRFIRVMSVKYKEMILPLCWLKAGNKDDTRGRAIIKVIEFAQRDLKIFTDSS